MGKQVDVVQMIADLAIVSGSGPAESMAILAEAMQKVAQCGSSGAVTSNYGGSRVQVSEEQDKQIKIVPKEPPMKHSTQKLCSAGVVSTCLQCGQNMYRANQNVYNDMVIDEFVDCFDPIGHNVKLPIPLNLQMLDDSCYVDCPACHGELTLVLWGKGRKPVDEKADSGVHSIGEGDFA